MKTKKAVKKHACRILQPSGKVKVPALQFVAKDHFIVDIGPGARVKINGMCDNFKEWFLGKTEDPILQTTLCVHKLRLISSLDTPIIAELGGEAKAETTLQDVFSLMQMQWYGQGGILLTNGYVNIFYVRDVNGALRTVRVRWYDDGWRVDAHDVLDPTERFYGRQVFSRNS